MWCNPSEIKAFKNIVSTEGAFIKIHGNIFCVFVACRFSKPLAQML